MRVIPYIVYLLIIGLNQVILRDATSINGASLNLAAFLVVAVALYKSEVTAAWFGFAAGVVVSAGEPQLIGWHALIFMLLGVVAHNVKERVNLESLYSKLLLIFGGVLIENIIALLIVGPSAFFYRLWSVALTGTIYTALIALVFFLFKEGIITAQKIRSIF